MSEVTRAEALVQTIERDEAFRTEVEAAQSVPAKRAVLDAHGFQDVGLDEMRAYVETKGGTLVVRGGGHELSEQELAAVAGGITDAEATGVIVGTAVGGVVVGVASVGMTLAITGGISAASAAAA